MAGMWPAQPETILSSAAIRPDYSRSPSISNNTIPSPARLWPGCRYLSCPIRRTRSSTCSMATPPSPCRNRIQPEFGTRTTRPSISLKTSRTEPCSTPPSTATMHPRTMCRKFQASRALPVDSMEQPATSICPPTTLLPSPTFRTGKATGLFSIRASRCGSILRRPV